MAKIHMTADKNEESSEPMGGGNKFPAAPRGFYRLQIVKVSDGLKTTGGAKANIGTPMTKFDLEIAEGDYIGTKVWHNVTWLPKKAKGHGIAVHFLHATAMPYDGVFDFDEDDFYQEQHCFLDVLLEVEEYESKTKDASGKPFINEKNVIREIYTDSNPPPDQLPPEPVKRAPKAAASKPAAGGNGAEDLEGVPF